MDSLRNRYPDKSPPGQKPARCFYHPGQKPTLTFGYGVCTIMELLFKFDQSLEQLTICNFHDWSRRVYTLFQLV